MTNALTTGFDYDSVDKDTAGKLAYYADCGHKLLRTTQVEFIAKMGELLSEAQAELASHRNGTFIRWASAEFDLSAKTVYNYVNAWDRLLCNGYTIYQTLSPTAIYLLTSGEPAKPVLKKVEHLAAQQEPVRKADIQRILGVSKPKSKPKTTAGPGKPQSEESVSAGASEPERDANEDATEAAETGNAAAVASVDEPEQSTAADIEARWKNLLRELNQIVESVTYYRQRKATALRMLANRLDPPTKFTPPTLEEVTAYCRERKNTIDPEAFVAHYTGNGWRVGKGTGKPMKDWRASVITWEKMSGSNGKATSRVHGGVDYSEYEYE